MGSPSVCYHSGPREAARPLDLGPTYMKEVGEPNMPEANIAGPERMERPLSLPRERGVNFVIADA